MLSPLAPLTPVSESFFGGGGTSDVFITIKPIGREQYSEQKTDIHHRSPGDAEFN